MPSVIPDFRTLRSSLFQNISSATEIGFPGVALCFVATAGPLGDGPFPTGARRQRGPLRAVGSGAFSVNPSRLGGDDTAQPLVEQATCLNPTLERCPIRIPAKRFSISPHRLCCRCWHT